MGILKTISSRKLSESAYDDDSWHLSDLGESEPVPIQPAADARPCDICSFVGFWIDYDGARRCARCYIPPTLAVVQSFVGAVEIGHDESGRGIYGWCDLSEEIAPAFARFYADARKQRADASAAASLGDF